MSNRLNSELSRTYCRGDKGVDGTLLPSRLAKDEEFVKKIAEYGLGIEDLTINKANICPPYIKWAKQEANTYITKIQNVISNERSNMAKRSKLIYWAMIWHISKRTIKGCRNNGKFEPLSLRHFCDLVGIRRTAFYSPYYGNGDGWSPDENKNQKLQHIYKELEQH